MRNGIKDYFNNDPLQDSDETTDAAFIRNAGVTNVIFGNDFNNGINVDSGAFSDSP